MASPYEYAPLADPKSSIRLLSVTSIDAGRIWISLREVPSLNSTSYNCLSYTWGPDHPQIEIICDGRPFKIFQNLYNALIHLHRLVPDKVASIWIDAVCINQSGSKANVEKGPQLSRMDQIYAGAESVVMWLGLGPGSVVMSKFEDVARRVDTEFPQNGTEFHESILEINSNIQGPQAPPAIDEINVDRWLAVHEIAYRDYFCRQWIWQEVLAATADPIVVCGDHIVTWNAIRKASHALVTFGQAKLTMAGAQPVVQYLEKGMNTCNLPYQLAWWRDQYQSRGQEWMRARFGMLVLQGNRNAYTCKNERDRLYAMIGICGYRELDNWDYGRPFEELYTHFWTISLKLRNNVNLLTFVEDASARLKRPAMQMDPAGGLWKGDLPSWVPDLRAPLTADSMSSYFQYRSEFNISKGLVDRSGRQPPQQLQIDPLAKTLKMDGYLFDKVQCWGTSFSGILELIRRILADPWTEDDSHEGALMAVWRSMALLSSTEHNPVFPITEEMGELAKGWFQNWITPSKEGSTRAGIFASPDPALVAQIRQLDVKNLVIPPPGAVVSPVSANESDALESGMRGTSVFRTQTHFIGQGPASLRAGDEIWVVPGAVVAFALRPLGSAQHAFVGQCCLFDMMGGEMCGELQGKEAIEITLA